MAVLLMLAAGCARAQSDAVAGMLSGTVSDGAGHALPGVRVTATAEQLGVQRETLTDAGGAYRITALPPALYTVRLEAAEFRTTTIENIALTVGGNVTLRSDLQRLEKTETVFRVAVTSEAPLVETERVQQSTVIETIQIDNLPIDQRNYLDFALLTPTAVSTVTLPDDVDYRTPQSPQSGISFAGNNGRGNMFTVDGMENYYNTGGVRPSLSQDAVQEFQVTRSNFSAEFGGSTGGVINVVSRTGSDTFHATAFGFLRNRALDARNFFDPRKSGFTRAQEGLSAGGPIQKGRLFWFGAFERLDRHETVFVPILSDRSSFAAPTASQQQFLGFLTSSGSPQLAALGAGLTAALTPNNFPGTVKLFEQNSGVFPFSQGQSQASMRLDWRKGRHLFFLRGMLTDGISDHVSSGALVGLNRSYNTGIFDASLAAGATLVFSPHWLSETRLSFGFDKYDVSPVDPNGPQIDINGYGFFGRPIYLPSKNLERHFEADQIMSWTTGRHAVRFGAEINPVRDAVVMNLPQTGLFSFGQDIPLGAVVDGVAGQGFSEALAARSAALAAELAAPLTSVQAYDLGLPDYFLEGFGDPRWTGWTQRYSFFAQDDWNVHPRLHLYLGARYELELKNALFPLDPNNIAPRVGLAWDPWGDAKTVVRAAYGIFYGRIDSNLNYSAQVFAGNQLTVMLVPLSGLPGSINPFTAAPVTSADIYGYLAATGVLGKRPPTAADLAPLGLVITPGIPLATRYGVDPRFVNPYSQQSSLEVEHSFGNYTVSVGYQFARGVHLERSRDWNVTLAGQAPNGQPIFGFVNPLLLQYNVWESTGNSFYSAMVAQVSRRLRRNFTLNASYTLSHATDDVTDFQPDFEPNNQLDIRADRGLSSFNQKHRLVANAVYMSPWHAGHGAGFMYNLFGDFVVSPIAIAASNIPFNILTGFDSNGDRHVTNDRPYGAGRNIGIGPDFFTANLRVSRDILHFNERSLQIIAEGFNLTNHTNFATLNNIVGAVTLAELPNPIRAQAGNPTSPLSYTSALDPRQFQFGLRLRF